MAKSIQPIIIKKVKKAAHGHHGGAWKIAYADFVTAMMAFFLLMWLISMTTQEQKTGLANYFAPPNLSPTTSGSGGILMGTTIDKSGAKASDARDVPMGGSRRTSDRDASHPAASGQANQSGAASGQASQSSAANEQASQSAAASIRAALQKMPDFAELSRNILIEPTRDGLNISITDQDGRSMFPEGSVQPYERTRLVLETLAPTLRRLQNRLSVTGHTAAARPGSVRGVDSWSLTAGRAVAVREILSVAGFPTNRFTSLVGRADTEPAFPDNPYLAANRRVTITLINEPPPLPSGAFP
jgi:chemotaxis protein MotB